MKRDRDWVALAECAGMGELAEVFHSPEAGDIRMAKMICQGCPVKEQCLQDAVDRCDPFGVWGGTTFQQRKRLMARLPSTHR